MKIKQGIPEDRRHEVITWAYDSFKHVIEKDYFFHHITYETNWSISAMLLDDNDKLLGTYLLGDNQVSSIIKTTEYDELKGIEGILLAVDPSIRGLGWGNKLKDYPRTLDIGYIWGQQFKSLNNLNDWLKRRILVGETENVYVTLQQFKVKESVKEWTRKAMANMNVDTPPIPLEERMSMEELGKCLPEIDSKSTKAAFDFITRIFKDK